MSNRISSRDRILMVFLAVLLIAVSYYMFFYKPLQEEMQSISMQAADIEDQTNFALAKANSMKSMQDELDEILSRPANEITEIAPYDNAKVVMAQLNGILSASENYSLNFKDPVINADGTVRRVVQMTFDCKDYNSAKAIVEALSSSRWRCLINSISMESSGKQYEAPAATAPAGEDGEQTDEPTTPAAPVVPQAMAMEGAVSIKATITFFESTKVQ